MDERDLRPEPAPDGNGKDNGATIIRELRDRASRDCAAEVEGVLKRHGCKLIAIPVLVPDAGGGWRIVTRINCEHAG